MKMNKKKIYFISNKRPYVLGSGNIFGSYHEILFKPWDGCWKTLTIEFTFLAEQEGPEILSKTWDNPIHNHLYTFPIQRWREKEVQSENVAMPL